MQSLGKQRDWGVTQLFYFVVRGTTGWGNVPAKSTSQSVHIDSVDVSQASGGKIELARIQPRQNSEITSLLARVPKAPHRPYWLCAPGIDGALLPGFIR